MLARYTPGARAVATRLKASATELRTRLRGAKQPAAQAAALETYRTRLGAISARLRALTPPPILAASHRAQLARLADVRVLAGRLRTAIRDRDSRRLAKLLIRFRRARGEQPERRGAVAQGAAGLPAPLGRGRARGRGGPARAAPPRRVAALSQPVAARGPRAQRLVLPQRERREHARDDRRERERRHAARRAATAARGRRSPPRACGWPSRSSAGGRASRRAGTAPARRATIATPAVVERLAGVGDQQLVADGDRDHAGDDRQVQVGVGVAGEAARGRRSRPCGAASARRPRRSTATTARRAQERDGERDDAPRWSARRRPRWRPSRRSTRRAR